MTVSSSSCRLLTYTTVKRCFKGRTLCITAPFLCLLCVSVLGRFQGPRAAPLPPRQLLPGGAETGLHGARMRGGEMRLRGGPRDFPGQRGDGKTSAKLPSSSFQRRFKRMIHKLEAEVDSPPKLQSGLNFCAGFFLITQRNKRDSSAASDKCTFVSVVFTDREWLLGLSER